jgi:hypothetical protein
MYFIAEDPGPFWLNPKEQGKKRYDIVKEATKTKRLFSKRGSLQVGTQRILKYWQKTMI